MKELFIEAEIEIVILADDLLTDLDVLSASQPSSGFDVEEGCE